MGSLSEIQDFDFIAWTLRSHLILPATTNCTTDTNMQVIAANLLRNESSIHSVKYSEREKEKYFGAEEE